MHLALQLMADQPMNHVLLVVVALLSCQCLHLQWDHCPDHHPNHHPKQLHQWFVAVTFDKLYHTNTYVLFL
jgi:hypothetical protein